MHKILSFVVTVAIVFSADVVFAFYSSGFVEIAPGKSLFVDYIPAEPGRPTLVLLNGLTYSTENWNQMMPFLKNHGFGILRYDAVGEGKTLQRFGNDPKTDTIKIEDQARDLLLLLKHLNINTKVSLVGLSYGGGLDVYFASHFPNIVDKVILMAPFVAPLPNQDAFIRSQISATRLMFPYNPLTDDELYDYFLHEYIFKTFPLADPTLINNTLRLEAAYRLTVGIRKMDYRELVGSLPNNSVHLLMALQDEYIPFTMLDRFWQSLPESKRVSRINLMSPPNPTDPLNLTGYFHRMPESIPEYAAAWITLIMKNHPAIAQGRTFAGNTFTGTAQCGNILLKLLK